MHSSSEKSEHSCWLQVRRLLQHDPNLLDKYEQKLLDSYIEDNKSVRWCPSVPHCGCAIQVHCSVLYRACTHSNTHAYNQCMPAYTQCIHAYTQHTEVGVSNPANCILDVQHLQHAKDQQVALNNGSQHS